MTKGERTRQHIVETAAVVLNKHGFTGAGMSELMAETGLAKGGLYRHFSSKEALAVEAFQHAFATVQKIRWEGLDDIPNSIDKLKVYLDTFVTKTSPIAGGCPILNTTMENDDGNPALLKCAQNAFDTVIRRLTKVLKDGQTRGEVHADIVPGDAALFLYCTVQGGVSASRLGPQARIKVVVKQLQEWLELQVRAS